MSPRTVRAGTTAAAVVAAALLAVTAVHSTRWVGARFPGFFVMENRVVASVGLPDWLEIDPASVFQHQVLAVDAVPMRSAGDVYARVAAEPPGTPVRYVVRASDGRTATITARSRVFGATDWALIFGAYFLNGLAFIATALVVYRLKPTSPASLGLLAAGLSTGIFVITAADLYGPHWFFRLHVAAESLMGAGFIHLALVFPTDRLGVRRGRAVAVLYAAFLALAAWYEWVLNSPSLYTAAHLTATAGSGLAAAAMMTAVTYDFVASRSRLVRRRTSVVVLGCLTGFLVPGIVMVASALFGGTVPLNAAALTAFLFPVSLGYAVVKRDLFDIDVVLRRGITYMIVLLTIAALEYLAMFLLGVLLPDHRIFTRSPAAVAMLNLGLLFLVSPLHTRAQAAVDRVFFRTAYDPEQALVQLSHRLASAHTLDEVGAHLWTVLVDALSPVWAGLFLAAAGGRFTEATRDGEPAAAFVLPPDLARRAEQGEPLSRYEWEEGSRSDMPAIWDSLRADVLIPVRNGTELAGMIALGPKQSGRTYTVHDVAFLDTAASQVALAIKNAEAFEDLKRAYEQLERNQASLMRADRLATLGRLTAGIAHEVNTPLAAVLNALKLVSDLGAEYAESIGDPAVKPEDHREIAAEIIAAAESAVQWARKAGAFINNVKMHGRDSTPGLTQPFTVRAAVEDTQALLAHRLRAASCHIELRDEPRGITLLGDRARLGQVLVNVVANAIDAYEERGAVDGRIEVEATRDPGAVVIRVRDGAGGIPSDVVPRIFEELFTTKEPGRGTGLGLSISRHLIEDGFDGTLTVESEAGVGSVFTIRIPIARAVIGTALPPAA